jgi:hypothetical protein
MKIIVCMKSRVCTRNHLKRGSATFSLPRAALAIHIFVEGLRKINNVVDRKRNCVSLTQGP